MRRLMLAWLLVLACAPGCARADWIDPGIAFRCDAGTGEFGLAATMSTSSPETPGEVGVPAGYAALSKANDDLAVACPLGGAQVSAAIHILGAREHGQCSALDSVDIVRLQVDGEPLIEHTLFNGGCHTDPVLHRIELRARGAALWLRTCRAPWDWDIGYAPDVCEEREIRRTGPAGGRRGDVAL